MKNKVSVSTIVHNLTQKLLNRHTQHRASQYAWWILEAITEKNRAALLAEESVALTPAQAKILDGWIKDHIEKNKPLPYILGWVPFGPLHILVKPPILIPRPETEEWTLSLAEKLQKSNTENLTILDLCTGTGCIGLTLAHLLPNAKVWTTDINPDALKLVQNNAMHNGIGNISFIQSDLFDNIPPSIKFDIIVSNPPYIHPDDWKSLDLSVSQWEDQQALVANDEGYALIKKIITQAPNWLKKSKLINKKINNVHIELADKQAHTAADLFKRAGYTNISIEKDMFGNQRVVSGNYTKPVRHPVLRS